MMQSNTAKTPTYRAYAVTQGKNKKSFWREIGAAWAHEDGKGFSLKLDFLPMNQADIVIREPLPPKTDETGEDMRRPSARA
jgi:hypothetical protein